MSFRVLDAGDAALTIEFGSVIDPALLAAVNALDAAIGRLQQAGALPGVIETMPTFRSLTVFYDPLATSRAVLQPAVQALLDSADGAPSARRMRHQMFLPDSQLGSWYQAAGTRHRRPLAQAALKVIFFSMPSMRAIILLYFVGNSINVC